VSGPSVLETVAGLVRRDRPGQSELELSACVIVLFLTGCVGRDHILEQHIHNIDVGQLVIGEYPLFWPKGWR